MSFEANQISAISRLFSSAVIRELARKGKSPLFARLAHEARLFDIHDAESRISALFDTAFSILRKKIHRHEYVYKAALTQNVLLGTHSLQTASMLTEFRVAECKADLVIFNGTATVYEIKSERDTLSRLQKQIEAYQKVFAKVYVIAGENHIDSVLDMTPDDVGVLRLSAHYNISQLRKAQDVPLRTQPQAIFDAVRIDEAKRILIQHGVKIPDAPNTEMHSVLREEFCSLTPLQAHSGMVSVLKKTRNLMPLSDLICQLPISLHSAALTIAMRKADHVRFISAVNSSVSAAKGWA